MQSMNSYGIRSWEAAAEGHGADEAFVHNWNQITIESWMWGPQGLELRLGTSELLAFALVYGSSHHDGGEFQRSYKSTGEFIGVKRRQCINIFKNLESMGLICSTGQLPWTGRENSFVKCYRVSQSAIERKLGFTCPSAGLVGDELVLREWMWDKNGLGLKVASLPICVYARIYDATRLCGGLRAENQGRFAELLGVDQAQLSRALATLRSINYIAEIKTETRYERVYRSNSEAVARACENIINTLREQRC